MPLSLKKTKNLIILLSLIFIQLVVISIQVPIGEESNYFERVVFSVFSPVNNGVVSVFRGIGSVWKNYFALHNVRKENQRLKNEVFRLNQENSLLHGVLDTYKTESEMRETLSRLEDSILPARIIGLDASNVWKSLTINKGSMDGVRKDMVVLDKLGHLVGRIVEPITYKQARVQLITDTHSGVHVVPREKDAPGIVSGVKNGECKLEYIITTDTRVVEGDELFTTGKDGIYMPGILVGRVDSIKDSASSLFKEIRVVPAFQLQKLDMLAVITADANELF